MPAPATVSLAAIAVVVLTAIVVALLTALVRRDAPRPTPHPRPAMPTIIRRRRAAEPQVRPSATMPKYFREAGPSRFDIVVYELSVRPHLPVMDLLYFEYLRSCLEAGTIETVYVVPWNGYTVQTEATVADAEMALLTRNLTSVFGGQWAKVEVVFGGELSRFNDTLLSRDFFDSLERLGDSQFLGLASRLLNTKFKTIRDINSGHPEKTRPRALVEHSIRGWLIYNFLLEERLRELRPDQSCNIGSLMWERELVKTLLLRNVQDQGAHWGMLVGASIGYRKRGRRQPLPTFEAATSIEVFGDFDEQVRKLETKSLAELRQTRKVMRTILSSKDPWWPAPDQYTAASRSLRARAVASTAQTLQMLSDSYRGPAT